MTTKLCPNCNRYARGSAADCPHCGFALAWTPPMKDKSEPDDIRRFITNLANGKSVRGEQQEPRSVQRYDQSVQRNVESAKVTPVVRTILAAHDFSVSDICTR